MESQTVGEHEPGHAPCSMGRAAGSEPPESKRGRFSGQQARRVKSPKRSKLDIRDVSKEDLELVSETSFECIDCVHTLVAKANSIHAPAELRNLSLTLAVLERQLFNYVKDHLIRDKAADRVLPRPGSVRSVRSNASQCELEQMRRDARNTLQEALDRAHENLDDSHIPLICGGVASLLHNLKGALLDTRECVTRLNALFYAMPKDALLVAAGLATACAGVYRLSESLITVQLNILTRPMRWKGPMQAPFGIHLNVQGRWAFWVSAWWRLLQFWRRRSWVNKALLSLVVAAYAVNRGMRFLSMWKLRQCHRQLLLLQRIMQCVTFALREARVRRNKSYVELVAYPSNPYLYTYTKGRHYVLKYLLDVFYASLGTAWKGAGKRWWLALPLASFTLPYFITHPNASSAFATGIRQHMSPDFFRFLVWTGNNAMTRWVLSVLYLRRFETRRLLRVNGVPTYVFHMSKLPACVSRAGFEVGRLPWEVFWPRSRSDDTSSDIDANTSRNEASSNEADVKKDGDYQGPVIVYVHGGGFCTSLLSMDIPFVSMLGQRTRAPIVIAEYSTAPERPYPHALNEVSAAYEWVRGGGLGFKPTKVIMVGESAGGNLVCAMLVRYVTQRLKLPDAVVVAYPALNLGSSPSPSRALHMCDPVLPIAASNLARSYYQTDERILDPQVSPIFTPDEILAQFPPTSIMTGGMDILLDDAVDFHVRLRRNGVPGRFQIFRTLPHGFWSMGDILKEAKRAQHVAIRWVIEALRTRTPARRAVDSKKSL